MRETMITQQDIQHKRDWIKDRLSELHLAACNFMVEKQYLPHIIDMIDGYEFYCRPAETGADVIITVIVKV